MAEAFSRVGGEVVDVVEPPVGKNAVDGGVVGDGGVNEAGAPGHVIGEPSTEVVDDRDLMAPPEERLGHV